MASINPAYCIYHLFLIYDLWIFYTRFIYIYKIYKIYGCLVAWWFYVMGAKLSAILGLFCISCFSCFVNFIRQISDMCCNFFQTLCLCWLVQWYLNLMNVIEPLLHMHLFVHKFTQDICNNSLVLVWICSCSIWHAGSTILIINQHINYMLNAFIILH